MTLRFLHFACPALLAPALLGGCVAKTVVDVATAPVRVASGAVDLATTSQSEADEKRGRAMREREEELGRMQRQYEQYEAECLKGNANDRACRRAVQLSASIGALESEPPED